jgi:hypothetical protein
LFHERRRLGVEILRRQRFLSDQHQRECRIAMALLAGNSLRIKPHDAELARGAAGCVTVLTAITLPLLPLAPMPIPVPMSALPSSTLPFLAPTPAPVPTISAAASVIDGEESAKGFLAKVARIIKSPVTV